MYTDRSASWPALRDQYQALVDQPPVDAAAVWRLLTENAWYQRELYRTAGWIVRHRRLRHFQADDVCQEAILILRFRLARRADLGIDRLRGGACFGAWLRRIIHDTCLDALRRLARREPPCAALPAPDTVAERGAEGWRRELRDRIACLPEPRRSVLTAYCESGTLGEAAASLGMNYQRARRNFLAGIALLRLGDQEDPIITKNFLIE